MHWLDILIITLYLLGMLSVGYYFLKKNKDPEDYYVGGRKMGSLQIGLSVVATDVGGGFSIGLGGLGFIMGISGSWMLFTGLIGAWITSAILIPRVFSLGYKFKFLTFPQIFSLFYNPRVVLLAGIISAIGYLGFTSSQILAGAKLVSSTFTTLTLNKAIILMGVITIVYTVMGGLKAVVYTDTIQWLILMGGLLFIGIPLGYIKVGGYQVITDTIPQNFFSLTNVTWQTLLKWFVTIVPIWFVGMTLYQRIYASNSVKQAKRAWFYAGLFEYPVMAFMGVLLGLFGRVAYENGMFTEIGFAPGSGLDAEMGLPLLLRTVLPVGLMGIMVAAYFSAIMSTADSCLMASSGNILTDILGLDEKKKNSLRYSQIITLFVGITALILAANMPNVLELMLYSYAFMVSGLFVPVVGALFWKRSTPLAAFWSMLLGGGTTITLIISEIKLPVDLDPNVFGISTSLIVFVALTLLFPKERKVLSGKYPDHE
ncbi:MAG: sodium:solute symporter family protein [Bacteroidetes bacterium]|nr:sodium:solute symporter family protein [Bacteroidota bacterium]